MKIKDVALEVERDLQQKARRLLSKTRMSMAELAEAMGCTVDQAAYAVNISRLAGYNFVESTDGRLFIHNIIEHGGRLMLDASDRGDGWTVFGIITDNHKGNRHHRQDVETAAYQYFAREGVKHVLNAGNVIDGEAKFNKNELLIHGMDDQIDYWADTTPVHKGITTHFITGDDHEGWYAQRECINIGNYMGMRAQKLGREDLHYIGHVESDIELRSGKNSVAMRIMHPGGGSSYAMSYSSQKIVESFQGGEKPPVLITGHYHKWDYCFPREVHVISAGCCEDQTMFMRKKKLGAHVGFSMVKLQQDKHDGHITRLGVEWCPYYDRGYYEKRFEK